MSIDALIMFAGVLVALMPFLGFPNSWDAIVFLVLGIIIIGLGIIVRRRGKPRKMKPPVEQSFVENAPPGPHE